MAEVQNRSGKLLQPSDATWLVILALLTAYSGSSVIAYAAVLLIVSLRAMNLRFTPSILVFLGAVTFYFLIVAARTDLITSIMSVKYFFGSLLMLFFFASKNYEVDFGRVALVISIITIAEAFLVNTVLSPELLPNYPKDEGGNLAHPGLFWGWYQRPYGIGTNASVTAGTLVVLLSMRNVGDDRGAYKVGKIDIVVFISILVCLSGTGFAMFALYYLFCFASKPLLLLILAAVSSFVSLVALTVGAKIELFEKISSTYFLHLLEYKNEQFEMSLVGKTDLLSWLFGNAWNARELVVLGGDFGWLNIMEYGGIFVLLMIFLILISTYNSMARPTIILLIISGFHYFSMFTLSGHIIIAYLLQRKLYNRSGLPNA